MTTRFFVRASALITLLVIACQAVWAVSMPGFRGPDEPHHVNSILRLADGGGWPAPGDATIDPGIIALGRESGTIVSKAETFSGIALTKLANNRIPPRTEPPFPTSFRNMVVVPHDERSSIRTVQRPAVEAAEVDQMSQHPPVYYAGGAAIATVFNLDEQPWDRMLLGLRLYGILLTVPLVPALIYSARRLGARRPWALAAGFLPFGIPQYFAITAGVTNDTLAIGAGALVVMALVKAGTEPISRKTVALVGGTLGFALWSKGLLLAFGLALILVFAVKTEEPWKTRTLAILSSGVAALAIGWWWVLNILRYGVIQPSGFVREVPEGWDRASADFSHFFGLAAKSLATSFFSAFGWLEADFTGALTWLLTGLLVVALVWATFSLGRNRRTFLAIISPMIGVLLLLFAESWSTYVGFGIVAGVQGRYLFPFIAILGAIVIGLQRFRGNALVLFASWNLAVGAYGYIFFLNSSYPGYPWVDFPRFALVSGLSHGVLTVILIVLVAVFLAAFATATWFGIIDSRNVGHERVEDSRRRGGVAPAGTDTGNR